MLKRQRRNYSSATHLNTDDENGCEKLFQKFMGTPIPLIPLSDQKQFEPQRWRCETISRKDWDRLVRYLANTHPFLPVDRMRFSALKRLVERVWDPDVSVEHLECSLNTLFLFALMIKFRYCCDMDDPVAPLEIPLLQYCHTNNVPRSTYQLFTSLEKFERDGKEKIFDLALEAKDPDALFTQGLCFFREQNYFCSAHYLRLAFVFGHCEAYDWLSKIACYNKAAAIPYGEWVPPFHRWCSHSQRVEITTLLLVYKRHRSYSNQNSMKLFDFDKNVLQQIIVFVVTK